MSEGPAGHVLHFGGVKSPGATHVEGLFHFPRDDAYGEKEEETGEEDREEYKEVDAGLVLAEEQAAEGLVFGAPEDHVEPS